MINHTLAASDMVSGKTLSVEIESVEDKGFVCQTGVQGVRRGFLSLKNLENAARNLKPGYIVVVSVVRFDAESGVAELTTKNLEKSQVCSNVF